MTLQKNYITKRSTKNIVMTISKAKRSCLMPNTSVPKQSGATSWNSTKMHYEISIVDSNCVLTTNQSMVEWEKQRKKDMLPHKIKKKTHLEPYVNTPERGFKG